MAAAGSIAAVSLLFGSPIIAAVLLLEALGLDREKLPLILLPGLLAAGIGSLISIGMGSLTGLSTSAYALGSLPLPTLDEPALADFAWTFLLAIGRRRRRLRGDPPRPAGASTSPAAAPTSSCPRSASPSRCWRSPSTRRAGGRSKRSSSPARIALPGPGHRRRYLVDLGAPPAARLQGPGVGRLARLASAAARRSRPSSSAPPRACSPRTCRASTSPERWASASPPA